MQSISIYQDQDPDSSAAGQNNNYGISSSRHIGANAHSVFDQVTEINQRNNIIVNKTTTTTAAAAANGDDGDDGDDGYDRLDELASTKGSSLVSAQSSSFNSNLSTSSNISMAIMKHKLLETLEIDLDFMDGLFEGNISSPGTDGAKNLLPIRSRNWKGNNTFLCRGLLMLGPSSGYLWLTLILIIGLWIGNMILVGPFFGSKIYYYIAIVLCTANVATLMVTASTDPGWVYTWLIFIFLYHYFLFYYNIILIMIILPFFPSKKLF